MVCSTGELVTFPASKLTGAAAQDRRKQHPIVSLKDSIALGAIVTKLSGSRRGYIVKQSPNTSLRLLHFQSARPNTWQAPQAENSGLSMTKMSVTKESTSRIPKDGKLTGKRSLQIKHETLLIGIAIS
jgi:hypothetical protein